MSFDFIDESTYKNDDVVLLAKYFIGKHLVTNINNKLCVSKIVETEAYKAPEDKASHAYKNKRTQRTETMFLSGGRSYVYLCYGIHNMFNIVTGPEEQAHAILVRAVEPIIGLETMRYRRKGATKYNLTNGPGKLCKALGITREHNNLNLSNHESKVWIEKGEEIEKSKIMASPRVGIAYAKECALWPWRFRLEDNRWTSLPNKVIYDE